MILLSVALISALIWPQSEPAIPERWHAWPASKIFPSTLPGKSPSGAHVTYVLAGIAPETSCRDAFQPPVARAMANCVTALRATYSDSTQTFVATAGIAVLSGSAERFTGPWGTDRPPTVRPVAFPGAAEMFGERQYITGAVEASGERYVVLTAAGYSDGRIYRPGGKAEPRLSGVAKQLAAALNKELIR
ncbi:hypothetical protein ACIBG8_50140 [Nonomuraea sp. NPDC050556]|uniref:hypothetical protein n=1 Tax=Nonomuraea sp. NPDC050556 TaxID=3364369 RepID=UPI003796CBBE